MPTALDIDALPYNQNKIDIKRIYWFYLCVPNTFLHLLVPIIHEIIEFTDT
jgi:hypothetical protein